MATIEKIRRKMEKLQTSKIINSIRLDDYFLYQSHRIQSVDKNIDTETTVSIFPMISSSNPESKKLKSFEIFDDEENSDTKFQNQIFETVKVSREKTVHTTHHMEAFRQNLKNSRELSRNVAELAIKSMKPDIRINKSFRKTIKPNRFEHFSEDCCNSDKKGASVIIRVTVVSPKKRTHISILRGMKRNLSPKKHLMCKPRKHSISPWETVDAFY